MIATWRKHAACRGIDPDVFYPASDEEAGAAKAVCDQCAVREACLEYALANREREVFGAVPPSGNDGGSTGSAASRPDPDRTPVPPDPSRLSGWAAAHRRRVR